MANVVRWLVSFNLIDGAKRSTGNTYYISEANANEWLGAADDAARAASQVGLLQSKEQAMIDAPILTVNVGNEVLTIPIPSAPAATVLRGNKLKFQVISALGKKRDFTLPCRKPASFTQLTHSIECETGSPVAMSNWIAQYNSMVLDFDGNSNTITDVKVVD